MIGHHYIEAMCEAGFDPADECAAAVSLPRWASTRFEAVLVINRDEMLTADYSDDEVRMTRCMIQSGVSSAQIQFAAADEHMSDLDYAAFLAVADAWSK